MASLKNLPSVKLGNTKDGLAVYGYIRENFGKKCWIDTIMATIIQFYVIKGGSLYVFGDGKNGRLGIEEYKDKMCKTPTLCPPFTHNNAYKVCAGAVHTMIVDEKGNVWCCGLGVHATLGGKKMNSVAVPTKLSLNNRIVSVSAGLRHTLLLCDNGWVQALGWNNFGQLGHGNLENSLFPKTIEKLKKYKVVQVCAGGKHSAASTEDGDLFCFGDNEIGQCGVGMEKGNEIMTPTKVEFDEKIAFVECGSLHTLLITRKALIYSFGDGDYGKLGHGHASDKYIPTLIEALKQKRIKTCAGGRSHSLCADEDGIIWAFGRNKYGECGLSSDTMHSYEPKMLQWFIANNIKASECAAGNYTSSVIAENGSLYVFGKNDKFQLGLEEQKNYFTPTKLSLPQNARVKEVSMSNDAHTAIICEVMN